MSYDQIRAYAILAAEPYPVPDPLALIARCGCANFVLSQWSRCVYEDTVSPKIDHNELRGTFWNIPSETTSKATCGIHYDLTHHYSGRIGNVIKGHDKVSNWSDDIWSVLNSEGLGYPFVRRHLQYEQCIVVDDIAIISDAFVNKGHASTQEISGSGLLPEFEAKDVESLNTLVGKFKDDTDPANRKDRAKKLREIFILTITSATVFNPKGGGRPLLVSAKAIDVSTNSYKNDIGFHEKDDWSEGCSNLLSLKMNDIFKRLESGEEEKLAIDFLLDLTAHVLSQSGNAIVEPEDDDHDNEGATEDQTEVLNFNDGHGGDDDDAPDENYDEVDLIDDLEEYFDDESVYV